MPARWVSKGIHTVHTQKTKQGVLYLFLILIVAIYLYSLVNNCGVQVIHYPFSEKKKVIHYPFQKPKNQDVPILIRGTI